MSDYESIKKEMMRQFFSNMRAFLISCPSSSARETLEDFINQFEDTYYVDNPAYREIVKELANDDARFGKYQ